MDTFYTFSRRGGRPEDTTALQGEESLPPKGRWHLGFNPAGIPAPRFSRRETAVRLDETLTLTRGQSQGGKMVLDLTCVMRYGVYPV